MSRLRFNHVFVGLLLLSVLSAFVISPRYTNPVRSQVQGIFFPVALPARSVGGWIHGKFATPEDTRDADDVREENMRLRNEVAQLASHIDVLKRMVTEQEHLGVIADLTERVPVMGTDPGRRDSLSLQGSFSSNWTGLPVLYVNGGLVGKIARAGTGGAQVQLVSDKGFAVTARFGRYASTDAQPLDISKAALLEGNGNGMMIIRNFQIEEVERGHLRQGDDVLLNDPEWPELIGHRIGTIASIEQRPDAPLNADIHVRPLRNLLTLREVRVVKLQ